MLISSLRARFGKSCFCANYAENKLNAFRRGRRGRHKVDFAPSKVLSATLDISMSSLTRNFPA